MESHEDAAVSFGTVLDHFAESGELTSLVETLPHICGDQIALEASQERFTGTRNNLRPPLTCSSTDRRFYCQCINLHDSSFIGSPHLLCHPSLSDP